MSALRRSIACLVLAGFVSAQATVWVAAHHAAREDDAACAAVDGPELIRPHAQAGLQFDEATPSGPIEHCAVCHMQRAVSGARPARVIATSTAPYLVGAVVEATPFVLLVVTRGSSPRGPPSLLA